MKNNNNNITELVFILDRSGSMHGLEGDTVGGFNSMIDEQKKQEGTVYVSTVLFSNDSTVLHDRVPLEKIEPLTESDYRVGGCTALLDAIGDAVKHIRNIHRYARPEDVPAHTMFVITTDGQENASRKYDLKEIKKTVSRMKEEGWEFLFIGANIDAISAAGSMGISADRAVNYHADACGTGAVFRALSRPIAAMRSSKCITEDWAEEINEDNARRGNA